MSRRFGYDLSVLIDRDMSLRFAEWGGLFVALAQAPIFGGCVVFGWSEGARERPFVLLFVLSLIAMWFGCFNGCREVVKELGIFLREKRLGVSVSAYLLSKFLVLGLIAFCQCLILTLIVFGNVEGLKLSRAVMMFYLFGTALAGTALGLFISTCVNKQSMAVGMVPIVLLPQLIFSEITLGERRSTENIESVLPVSWTFSALKDLWQSDWTFLDIVPTLVMIPVLTLVFLLLALLLLMTKSES